MVVSLVRNPTSIASNARLSIGSVVEEVKEDETVQQQQEDVEMLVVDQNFQANTENQEEAYNHHAFIQY
jgi:hypothetical protein